MSTSSPPLPRSALAEACRHAASAYPEECCGFIRMSGAVHRAVNIQGIAAGGSPALGNRSADRAFTFAGSDLYALGCSFRGDDPAVCIYHSHPEAPAYFSRIDRRDALYAGAPKYPVVYLVISVVAARPIESALFAWDGDAFPCVWRDAVAAEAIPGPHALKGDAT